MKNFFIYLAVFLCATMNEMNAQETFGSKLRSITENIEKISKEEKAALKVEVEAVNVELDKGSITKEQAEAKKMQLAEATAAKIENRVALEEAKLSQLIKEKVEGKLAENDDDDDHDDNKYSIRIGRRHKKDTIQKSERRTTSQFVFAAGVNNLVTDGMVANSDFRYWGSHFYEWGLTSNTRLSQNTNLYHLKYGFSVMYNNLRATNNRIFITNGDQTSLQNSPISLKDSRFKNVNLVVPVHFELDFSKNKTADGKPVFQSHKGFRLGLGGFAGVNINTKQFIEFNDGFGNRLNVKSRGNYNVNDFVYGASAYFGYSNTSLYLKYDLNPLFKDNPIKQNNISLGLRFDFN